MSTSEWSTTVRIGLFAGRVIGFFITGGSLYEILTRPDVDVGAFISLHGIYWAAVGAGAGLVLSSAGPFIRWLWGVVKRFLNTPERRRQEETYRVIKLLERVQFLTENELYRIREGSRGYYSGRHEENMAELRVVVKDLIELGFEYFSVNRTFDQLRSEANRILPYVRRHGAAQTVKYLREDPPTRESESD